MFENSIFLRNFSNILTWLPQNLKYQWYTFVLFLFWKKNHTHQPTFEKCLDVSTTSTLFFILLFINVADSQFSVKYIHSFPHHFFINRKLQSNINFSTLYSFSVSEQCRWLRAIRPFTLTISSMLMFVSLSKMCI